VLLEYCAMRSFMVCVPTLREIHFMTSLLKCLKNNLGKFKHKQENQNEMRMFIQKPTKAHL
jgi:hypothetical protein